MDFTERLRFFIENNYTKPYRIFKETGISQTTIGNYLKELTTPDPQKVNAIDLYLNELTDELYQSGKIDPDVLPEKAHIEKENPYISESIFENREDLKNGIISEKDAMSVVMVLNKYEHVLENFNAFNMYKNRIKKQGVLEFLNEAIEQKESKD